MRTGVLGMYNDDPLGAHFGKEKTITLTRHYFDWPELAADVKKYVQCCDICQRARANRHQPYGEMAALRNPDATWKQFSMNFVTDLAPSRPLWGIFRAILVIFRFTKMSCHNPTTKSCDAIVLANLFFERIICDFGVLQSIVSEQTVTLFSRADSCPTLATPPL